MSKLTIFQMRIYIINGYLKDINAGIFLDNKF